MWKKWQLVLKTRSHALATLMQSMNLILNENKRTIFLKVMTTITSTRAFQLTLLDFCIKVRFEGKTMSFFMLHNDLNEIVTRAFFRSKSVLVLFDKR